MPIPQDVQIVLLNALYGLVGGVIVVIGNIIIQGMVSDSQKEKKITDVSTQQVETAEKVRKMVEAALEGRILAVEEDLKDANKEIGIQKNRSNELEKKLERQRASNRAKVVKLETKLINGYNIILKLLSLLKQHEIEIPRDLEKEIEALKVQDTQQLEPIDPDDLPQI